MQIVTTGFDPGRIDPGNVDRQRAAKVKDGAEEFEAMMLGQMLKGLHFGGSPGSGGDDDAGGDTESLTGFGMETMAKGIASHGGFGLARQMIRQVTAEDEATKDMQGGTKVR